MLYGGGKGGGKSYLGATLIFGDALIYPGTHYFIARQELTDLNSFTLPTVFEVFKNWNLEFRDYASYNGQSHIFTLYNGSKVHFIACKEIPSDPLFERFGSMQMTRGWIEEGGEVAEAAKANLWLSIGRWKNDEYGLKKKMLTTANPKKGWMKREFVDPFKEGTLPETRKYVQALATDNVYLPADYVKSLSQEKDRVRRQRLFEGNWDYDEDMDSLVSSDALSDAFTNTITKDNDKYLTVDVARFGEDSTVIALWEGLELVKVDRRQRQDIEQTKQTIKDIASREQVPYSNILIDEDGVGGGVVDGLQGVKGFIANSTPIPTGAEIRERQAKIDSFLVPRRNFRNLKSQCAYKLAELINEHKIRLPQDHRDLIIEELSALLRTKTVDSDGKMEIRPKSKVKEDLGRSPDIGDTIIFRAWFELKRNARDDSAYEHVIQLQQNQFQRNASMVRSNK